MHKLYDLKEKLIEEMEDYADKGNLSKDDITSVKYLSSSVDHICNIIENCEEDEYSHRSSRYSRARRRDGMGRYSGAEESFRMEMEDLIHNAPNERIRQKMQNIMSDM